ncbi:MAG: hypothetical protein KKD39_08090 [Candidatus Altiarchaeota archaeon]|nr:hypothetical protein [Candidatus Altiarchaeota archaeon]
MTDSCVCAGVDIGGANLKCFVFELYKDGGFKKLYSTVRSFELSLGDALVKIKEDVGGVDVLGVTSTAEYSMRYFRSLGDGIKNYVDDLMQMHVPIYWITLDGIFVRNEQARDYYRLAAANWVASSLYIGEKIPNCILVDVGSTTADVIPILDGRPISMGIMDFERLSCGQLVYTGVINTPVASILRDINVGGKSACVSSEVYSISADVHLMLGNISQKIFEGYTHNTPPSECYTRLAHMVCADDELLRREDIAYMAEQVYDKQVRDIAEGIEAVYKSNAARFGISRPPVVVAGLGAGFLAEKAARKAGFSEVLHVGKMFDEWFSISLPAASVALLAGENFLGVSDED